MGLSSNKSNHLDKHYGKETKNRPMLKTLNDFAVKTKTIELCSLKFKYYPREGWKILRLKMLGGTAQEMKYSIKDFSIKCDQIAKKLRIWSHLLKKSLMESFIFCALWRS